jgi:Acyl-CoA dehydrogenase, N-terminal domain
VGGASGTNWVVNECDDPNSRIDIRRLQIDKIPGFLPQTGPLALSVIDTFLNRTGPLSSLRHPRKRCRGALLDCAPHKYGIKGCVFLDPFRRAQAIMSLFPRGAIPAIRKLACIARQAQTRRFLATQIDSITDSNLSETQLSVRQSIQKLCAQFPDDYWANADRTTTYPSEFRKAITEAGWLGITLPIEYGGAGLGVSEATVMMQTIAESGAGVAGAQSIHANIYPLVPVAKFGTSEQKERWLSNLIEGQHTACFGVTEPDVGSETYKLKTRAEKKRDKYIVNGQKMYSLIGLSLIIDGSHPRLRRVISFY